MDQRRDFDVFVVSAKLNGEGLGTEWNRSLPAREIKAIGDRFMAAFKRAGAALDDARALPGNPSPARLLLREPARRVPSQCA